MMTYSARVAASGQFVVEIVTSAGTRQRFSKMHALNNASVMHANKYCSSCCNPKEK